MKIALRASPLQGEAVIIHYPLSIVHCALSIMH